MAVLLVLLVASWLGSTAPETAPCRASPPRGTEVPAPIVLRTSCGGFLLERDGAISRLPQRWLVARSGGTGRRYGADLRVERTRAGRIILLRHGRVVWRSRDLYHRDGGDLTFGPGAFAFASYRRGIFVTDLRGPERLLLRGVGLYPLAFLRNGQLLVVRGGWGPSVSVLSRDGSLLRRYRYRPHNGYAFDEQTESLFFVTPQRVLVRAEGTTVRVVRALHDLDGWLYTASRLDGWLYTASRGLLVFEDRARVSVTSRVGEIVAQARWPAGWSMDSGLFTSRDGSRFAFRLRKDSGRTPTGGAVVVYALRAGQVRARPIYRHRLGESGCGVGASLSWHGSLLLYSSSDGRLAILDMHGEEALELDRVVDSLPHRPGEQVTASWMSDFRRPAVGKSRR